MTDQQEKLNRSGFAGGSNSGEGGAMSKQTSNKFSPEVRSRAVRLVLDHQHDHPSRWATNFGSVLFSQNPKSQAIPRGPRGEKRPVVRGHQTEISLRVA